MPTHHGRRRCLHCVVTVLFVLAVLPAIGQDNSRKVIKTVADYCIVISKKVDAMDDFEEDTLLSDLPVAKRPKMLEYLTSLGDFRRAIRRDACAARNLKTAKAATDRDLRKNAALTDEMLTYAHDAIAEAYRKKVRSAQGPK
jgi:hypothetical protein